MSAETLAVIISAVSLLLGFVAAFAWMIRRTDEQFAAMRTDLGTRISVVEQQLGEVRRELGEVKVAVARLEGPPRRLISAR